MNRNIIFDAIRRLCSGFNLMDIAFFLVLIFFCVFFQNKTEAFYDGVSYHGLALAKNTSYANPFFMFYGVHKDQSGQISYRPYNRFPPLAFMLIKFFSGLSSSFIQQIYLARQLMNLFYAATVFTAYLIASHVLKNRTLGIGAALITFSSFYTMYFKDMIFNDVPQLFFFTLLILLIIRKSDIKTIILASLAAALTGWQFISVLAAWVIINSIVFFNDKSNRSSVSAKHFILNDVSIKTFVVSSIFCLLILSTMLLNESAFPSGAPSRDGSVNSILNRIGVRQDLNLRNFYFKYNTSWEYNFRLQTFRFMMSFYPFHILRLADPYAHISSALKSFRVYDCNISQFSKMAGLFIEILKFREHSVPPEKSFYKFIYSVTALNLLIFVLLLLSLFKQRQNNEFIYSSSLLLLSPVLWLVLMRNFIVQHDFQSMYYSVAVLCVYINLISLLNKKYSWIWVSICCFFFVNALYYIDREKYIVYIPPQELSSTFESANIKNIRYNVAIENVNKGSNFDIYFYISGHYITKPDDADIIVTTSAWEKLYAQKYPLKKIIAIDKPVSKKPAEEDKSL